MQRRVFAEAATVRCILAGTPFPLDAAGVMSTVYSSFTRRADAPRARGHSRPSLPFRGIPWHFRAARASLSHRTRFAPWLQRKSGFLTPDHCQRATHTPRRHRCPGTAIPRAGARWHHAIANPALEHGPDPGRCTMGRGRAGLPESAAVHPAQTSFRELRNRLLHIEALCGRGYITYSWQPPIRRSGRGPRSR